MLWRVHVLPDSFGAPWRRRRLRSTCTQHASPSAEVAVVTAHLVSTNEDKLDAELAMPLRIWFIVCTSYNVCSKVFALFCVFNCHATFSYRQIVHHATGHKAVWVGVGIHCTSHNRPKAAGIGASRHTCAQTTCSKDTPSLLFTEQ